MESTPQHEISVVLPCYNEQGVVSQCHRRPAETLAPLGVPYECIYVDDGSRDLTRAELSVLQHSHRPHYIFHIARARPRLS